MAGVFFRGLLSGAAGGGGGGGGGSGYSFSKTITIDHTKCGAANTSSYPMLFSETIAALKTVGNGGSVQSGSGYDIVFFSDSGLTTKLDFEVESWSASTGAIVAWVRIPTLSSSVDTVIYLGYGNASITTSQQNVTGTWDANYHGVWHLGDGVNSYNTAMRADSTSNANTLGNVGSTGVAAAGIVGGGLSKNGTGDGLWNNSSLVTPLLSAFTVEVWCKPSSFTDYRTALSKGFGSQSNYKLLTEITSGKPMLQLSQSSGGTQKIVLGPSALSTSVFSYMCGTWDGSTLTLYLNGVSVGTPLAVTGSPDNLGAFAIGSMDQNSNPFAGIVDEGRISNVARSASYATATYNNISSPSTFYAVT